MPKKRNKPKVKMDKILKLGWGQTSRNASTLRRIEQADDYSTDTKHKKLWTSTN